MYPGKKPPTSRETLRLKKYAQTRKRGSPVIRSRSTSGYSTPAPVPIPSQAHHKAKRVGKITIRGALPGSAIPQPGVVIDAEVIEAIDICYGAPAVSMIESVSKWLSPSLKRFYLQHDTIPGLLDLPDRPIETAFVNLTLLEAKESEGKDATLKQLVAIESLFAQRRTAQHTRSLSIAKASHTGTAKWVHRNRARRVAILGRAGVGKSTLTQLVAYRWAKGNLWTQYDSVFVLPLRELNSYVSAKKLNLPFLLHRHCFRAQDRESIDKPHMIQQMKSIFHQIHTRSSQTLLVLDGFDEIAHLLDKMKYPAFTKTVEEALNHPQLIVTSRSYGLSTQQKKIFNSQIEVMGLSDANIAAFIAQRLPTTEALPQSPIKGKEHEVSRVKTTNVSQSGSSTTPAWDDPPILSGSALALYTCLRNNSSLWGLAHIPIILSVLCALYCPLSIDSTPKLLSNQMSLTKVYHLLVEKLIRHGLSRRGERLTGRLWTEIISQICPQEWVFLQRLAFYGMRVGRVVFNAEDIQAVLAGWSSGTSNLNKEEGKGNFTHRYPYKNQHSHHADKSSLERVLELGLLKSSGHGELIECQYYFIHLTFQEYFAARYLANGLQQPNPRHSDYFQAALHCLEENKYVPQYEVMWCFLAGLLAKESSQHELLQHVFHTKAHKVRIQRYQDAHIYFWDALIASKPTQTDVVGIRHVELIIRCANEGLSFRIGRAQPQGHKVENSASLTSQTRSNQGDLRSQPMFPHEQTIKRVLRAWMIPFTLKWLQPHWWMDYAGWLEQYSSTGPLRSHLSDRMIAASATSPNTFALIQFDIISELSDVLSHSRLDGVKRKIAVRIHKKLGLDNPKVVNNLIIALKADKDIWVRIAAIEVLSALIPGSLEVVAALLESLRDDEDELVLIEVVKALRSLRRPSRSVIKALLDVPRKRDFYYFLDLHEKVAGALGHFGQSNPWVIKDLYAALYDSHNIVRHTAARAVGYVGDAGPEVLTKLLTLLDDKDALVRSGALRGLGKLDIAGYSKAITRLLAVLSDDDEVRSLAADVLSGLRPVRAEVISGLLAALHNKVGVVRQTAAKALGRLGSSTPEVINGLLAAQSDNYKFVRQAAAAALSNLSAVKAGPTKVLHPAKCKKDRKVRTPSPFVKSTTHKLDLLSSEVIKDSLTQLFMHYIQCKDTVVLGKLADDLLKRLFTENIVLTIDKIALRLHSSQGIKIIPYPESVKESTFMTFPPLKILLTAVRMKIREFGLPVALFTAFEERRTVYRQVRPRPYSNNAARYSLTSRVTGDAQRFIDPDIQVKRYVSRHRTQNKANRLDNTLARNPMQRDKQPGFSRMNSPAISFSETSPRAKMKTRQQTQQNQRHKTQRIQQTVSTIIRNWDPNSQLKGLIKRYKQSKKIVSYMVSGNMFTICLQGSYFIDELLKHDMLKLASALHDAAHATQIECRPGGKIQQNKITIYLKSAQQSSQMQSLLNAAQITARQLSEQPSRFRGFSSRGQSRGQARGRGRASCASGDAA